MMEILSWQTRKKFAYFLLVFVVIAGAVALLVYFLWPEATCLDGRKNGAEEGIDCGGSCDPCVENPKDIVVLWTKVFKHGMAEGDYEAASLIKNPNLFYGLSGFRYVFKIYDSNNVLIAVREGETFVNPQDEFVIYETSINTGKREAVKALLEIDRNADWLYVKESKLPLVVSEKHFSNFPFPSFDAQLLNQSIFPVKDIFATAVLYDKEGNVKAVSSTRIDFIAEESYRTINFTWPDPFAEEPLSNEIFTRINSFLGD